MKRTLCAVGLAALCLTWAAPGRAVVLCVKKSGVLVQRQACKKMETALNLAQFGVVGPKGDKGDPGVQGPPGVGPPTMCPPDAVLVGTTCVDTYEASVWQIPPSNSAVIKKVQAGKATLADLTSGGATELSPVLSCMPTFPSNFPETGQWTQVAGSNPPSPGVYEVSVPGVPPSVCITWFQAAQACRLSGKRLLTNLEWQDAAAGTPDPGTDNGTTDCAASSGPVNTGSRSNCKSAWGVFDMVGNVWEWVADWSDAADGCTTWNSSYGGDSSCFGGPGSATSNLPGALLRGGNWAHGTGAGVFAVVAFYGPTLVDDGVGFRCAR